MNYTDSNQLAENVRYIQLSSSIVVCGLDISVGGKTYKLLNQVMKIYLGASTLREEHKNEIIRRMDEHLKRVKSAYQYAEKVQEIRDHYKPEFLICDSLGWCMSDLITGKLSDYALPGFPSMMKIQDFESWPGVIEWKNRNSTR